MGKNPIPDRRTIWTPIERPRFPHRNQTRHFRRGSLRHSKGYSCLTGGVHPLLGTSICFGRTRTSPGYGNRCYWPGIHHLRSRRIRTLSKRQHSKPSDMGSQLSFLKKERPNEPPNGGGCINPNIRTKLQQHPRHWLVVMVAPFLKDKWMW